MIAPVQGVVDDAFNPVRELVRRRHRRRRAAERERTAARHRSTTLAGQGQPRSRRRASRSAELEQLLDLPTIEDVDRRGRAGDRRRGRATSSARSSSTKGSDTGIVVGMPIVAGAGPRRARCRRRRRRARRSRSSTPGPRCAACAPRQSASRPGIAGRAPATRLLRLELHRATRGGRHPEGRAGLHLGDQDAAYPARHRRRHASSRSTATAASSTPTSALEPVVDLDRLVFVKVLRWPYRTGRIRRRSGSDRAVTASRRHAVAPATSSWSSSLVVLQTTVFPHLRVFGAVPDLLLVATIAVAYEAGPTPARSSGSSSGLAIDCFLPPLGVSALAFALVGYVVGVFQSGLLRRRAGSPRSSAGSAGWSGARSWSSSPRSPARTTCSPATPPGSSCSRPSTTPCWPRSSSRSCHWACGEPRPCRGDEALGSLDRSMGGVGPGQSASAPCVPARAARRACTEPDDRSPARDRGQQPVRLERRRLRSCSRCSRALFARLWFLQVGRLARATPRRRSATASASIQRARRSAGAILDARASALVQNTLVDTITVKRGLTPRRRDVTVKNLAGVLLAVTPEVDRRRPRQPAVLASTSRSPIAKKVTFDSSSYIEEHPELFPGVHGRAPEHREYPTRLRNGDPVGAHLLGYVAAINKEELQDPQGRGLPPERPDRQAGGRAALRVRAQRQAARAPARGRQPRAARAVQSSDDAGPARQRRPAHHRPRRAEDRRGVARSRAWPARTRLTRVPTAGTSQGATAARSSC